jgi:hypothetical protein
MREFNVPILDAANNNPVIYQIIKEYGIGRIITREEALSQMVVLLAKDWNQIKQQAFDMAMRLGVPQEIRS